MLNTHPPPPPKKKKKKKKKFFIYLNQMTLAVEYVKVCIDFHTKWGLL